VRAPARGRSTFRFAAGGITAAGRSLLLPISILR
jgi:hypothetical protein